MFDGIVSAGIGAVGSLLGGSQANQANIDIANQANIASADIAQKQMDFQANQRATQYQTAVTDMQKAGLNPMLAYSQGGSGNLAGASYTPQRAEIRDVVTPAINSALNARTNVAETALKEQQTEVSNAQIQNTRQDTLQKIAATAKMDQDASTSAAVEQVNRKQLDAIAAEIELKKAQKLSTTASEAKTRAEQANIIKNEAPSGDPYWYRDLKNVAKQAHSAWAEKIKNVPQPNWKK